MDQFTLGVLVGVVSSLLIYFLRIALTNTLNFLSGLSSRIVRGTWKTKFYKGEKFLVESARVNQFYYWIWGEITFPDRGRKYEFKGTVRSNVLVATYEIKGTNSTIDRGAFTLLVNPVGDVKTMNGKYSWTDDHTEKPEADKYEWTKIN
ncbi:MAG: hypothetical protein ACUZ8I_09420 [Candidatus Scalindua sp.]